MRTTFLRNLDDDVRQVNVELTRRNLITLLAKLDGNPRGSACTIFKAAVDSDVAVFVRAVENDEHYSDETPPGVIHEDTERAMLVRALDEQGHRPVFAHDLSNDELRARLRYCSEGAYDKPEPTEEDDTTLDPPSDFPNSDLHQGV
jgi:hypothetical protein